MELMITVSIAAILLAIGVPGMQDFVRNNRRAAEVNNLVATLQVARSEAVSRNKRVGVCSSTDGANCASSTTWDSGWIAFVDEDNDGTEDDGEEILRVDPAPTGMTVRATFASLAYLPNGRVRMFSPAGTGGDITFCDDRGASEARVVQIDLSGRPDAADKKLNGNAPTCPA